MEPISQMGWLRLHTERRKLCRKKMFALIDGTSQRQLDYRLALVDARITAFNKPTAIKQPSLNTGYSTRYKRNKREARSGEEWVKKRKSKGTEIHGY